MLFGCKKKKKGEMADGLKSDKCLGPLCAYCYMHPFYTRYCYICPPS